MRYFFYQTSSDWVLWAYADNPEPNDPPIWTFSPDKSEKQTSDFHSVDKWEFVSASSLTREITKEEALSRII